MRFFSWLFALVFSLPAWAEEAATTTVGGSLTRPGDYFGQILFSLVLVLVLIFAVAWMLRRFNRFSAVAHGHLKVHGVLQVGQRERILLLQVGEKQLLVGVTTSKISTIYELEEPLDVNNHAANSFVSNKFYQRLQQAMGQSKPE